MNLVETTLYDVAWKQYFFLYGAAPFYIFFSFSQELSLKPIYDTRLGSLLEAHKPLMLQLRAIIKALPSFLDTQQLNNAITTVKI